MRWVVTKAKKEKQDDTMVEFRVAMTSTCPHKAPIFHYKAYRQTCADSGSDTRSPCTAKMEPSVGAISPAMDLHGWKKITLEKQTS